MPYRILLAVLVFMASVAPASAAVPSLRDLGIEPVSVAPLLGESQLILIHRERTHTWTRGDKKFKKKAMFITSVKVVNAPVDKVRAVVAGFAHYPEFISEMKDVDINKADKTVEFETELNMLVLKLDVDYELAFTTENNGDITWSLVDGDFGEYLGRWEFFALPGGKTLLASTGWQDFESIGFTVRTVLKAQPEFKLVIPVATSAVMMAAMGRRAEGLPREEIAPKKALQPLPVVPMLSTGANTIPLASLRKLAEAGTLMLVHPKQWFAGKKGKPTDFQFMSAAAISGMPAEKLKVLATNFERFPEFMKQVDTIKRAPDADGKRYYDFDLDVGISIFTISVGYRLEYTDVTPLAIRYERVSGEIEHVYGAWEFFDVGDGKSLVMYTTGNKLGDDAPALLKAGGNAPNKDLIVGVSATALTIQKLMPWIGKQTAAE